MTPLEIKDLVLPPIPEPKPCILLSYVFEGNPVTKAIISDSVEEHYRIAEAIELVRNNPFVVIQKTP